MEASVFKMTHEQSLQQNGYTVCSPISGSMKPLIRPNVDSAVFVPPEKIRKYDVALYRREGQAIMHRVVGFRGEDTLIRGDNSSYTETVPRRCPRHRAWSIRRRSSAGPTRPIGAIS